MEDLRCYTLHFFYKVIGSGLTESGDIYVEAKMEQATTGIEDMTIENFNDFSDSYRKMLAYQLKVNIKNVIPVSRFEYEEHTEEKED